MDQISFVFPTRETAGEALCKRQFPIREAVGLLPEQPSALLLLGEPHLDGSGISFHTNINKTGF